MELESMVAKGEKTLWSGRPNRGCFVLEAVFNPMLPFALIWALIDLFVLAATIQEGDVLGFVVPFLLLHMMPVWIYLAGIFTIALRYKHEAYIITDRAVYTSHGMFSVSYNTKLFADMSRVDIHRGVIDQFLKVGDVVINTSSGTISIVDISDYEDVFKMVKQLQQDIYSDVQFPNAYRPSENPGYNTDYHLTTDEEKKQ